MLDFRFSDGEAYIGGFEMKVGALGPGKHVGSDVVGGPEERVGTRVHLDLKQEGDCCIVLFRFLDWRDPVEFMHHCSTKWAIFLMSLKALVETGKGTPSPDDIKIDNWN